MKIALASDHRGFKLKNFLAQLLTSRGHVIKDFGTYSLDSCDYPDYIYPASLAVRNNESDRAVLICYTGVGSAIAANKVKGVRAALVSNVKSAALSRMHNDANVLVLPEYLLTKELAKRIVLVWLKTAFDGGRHTRRLHKIKEIEEKENV